MDGPDSSAGGAQHLVGALEYAVLTALWEESPATVQTVLARVNRTREGDQTLAYTTVMTVMTRLHEKDLLSRAKQGRAFAYTPRHTEDELIEYLGAVEVAQLVSRFGEVALTRFASVLADARPETLARLLDAAAGVNDD